jgi:hypothetical protein
MGEWHMPICDVVKEVNLLFLEQQTCSNGMDRRITPTFVEESTILVQLFEEVCVRFRPEPLKVADFEVGPLREFC